ncbi:MAG: DeoR/GlpR family DNA-binding transcription regulator [Planctomycetaceae bacterium]|nr:DeoR/GlpR family DNA-binding transcription regulator [Planctomycetaceae bacterium]
MNASSQQRRDSILSQAYEKGHVSVKDLTDALAVSSATVRRDLRALADSGELSLTYGGASLARKMDFSFQSKAARNTYAKQVIGSLAAGLIPDGDQLFLDSGTTCFATAAFLRGKRGLSIILNSVRLAEVLDSPAISVILLGGQYRPARMDTIGPMATAALEQLRGYVAMIGADGLGMDFGLTAGDIDSAALYRLAVRNARQTILLADSSKFAAASLYKIVDWDAVSRVVTEQMPDQPWREFLASRNIEITCPETAQTT